MQFTISESEDRLAILQNWEQGAKSMKCETHRQTATMSVAGEVSPDQRASRDPVIDACCSAFVDRLIAKCREVEEVRGGG
jgi:hypothetical protein